MALTECPTKMTFVRSSSRKSRQMSSAYPRSELYFARSILGQIGLSCANVVEQHEAVVVGERWRYQPPHVLIATIPMGKHHWRVAAA